MQGLTASSTIFLALAALLAALSATPAQASVLWSVPSPQVPGHSGYWATGSELLSDDVLALVGSQTLPFVALINVKSGALVCPPVAQPKIPALSVTQLDTFVGSGSLFFTYDNNTIAMDIATGARRWANTYHGGSSRSSTAFVSPNSASHVFVMESGVSFSPIALSMSSGAPGFVLPQTPAGGASAIASFGEIVAYYDGTKLMGFDMAAGQQLWAFGGTTQNSTLVIHSNRIPVKHIGGYLYVCTIAGFGGPQPLLALDLTMGTTKFWVDVSLPVSTAKVQWNLLHSMEQVGHTHLAMLWEGQGSGGFFLGISFLRTSDGTVTGSRTVNAQQYVSSCADDKGMYIVHTTGVVEVIGTNGTTVASNAISPTPITRSDLTNRACADGVLYYQLNDGSFTAMRLV